MALIVKKLCARIGLDPAAYARHSMRSGFVTAVEANASIMKIARSMEMLRVYSRRADLFRDHASAGFA